MHEKVDKLLYFNLEPQVKLHFPLLLIYSISFSHLLGLINNNKQTKFLGHNF